jgi:23S rRNA G2069 N7-methylase RlmK/C1962 C5-methylase RlmI
VAAGVDAIAEMLANRVRRNARHLGKWAKREGVTCWRVYDRDIPEVPLTIDRYESALVIADLRRFTEGESDSETDSETETETDTESDTDSDRRPRATHDPRWLDAMSAAAAAALSIAPGDVFLKRRERQSGRREGKQYERLGDTGAWRTVTEAGRRFHVNLSDYLDTGLFLDHRITRARFAAEAAGKRVLNLFAYTGAFTVYAATAGAAASTTVDLSKTYLEWAGRNWDANAIDPARHERVHADVRRFLADARASLTRWDLAIVDPPTFSSSARMDYTWDVQRDHAALLADVARVMMPGGVVYFSTNRRRFQLADSIADADDLTAATIPPDFRDPKVHRVWRIRL